MSDSVMLLAVGTALCPVPHHSEKSLEQLEVQLGLSHFCLLLSEFVVTALGDLFPF